MLVGILLIGVATGWYGELQPFTPVQVKFA